MGTRNVHYVTRYYKGKDHTWVGLLKELTSRYLEEEQKCYDKEFGALGMDFDVNRVA